MNMNDQALVNLGMQWFLWEDKIDGLNARLSDRDHPVNSTNILVIKERLANYEIKAALAKEKYFSAGGTYREKPIELTPADRNQVEDLRIRVSKILNQKPEGSNQEKVIKRLVYNRLSLVDQGKFIRSGGTIED